MPLDPATNSAVNTCMRDAAPSPCPEARIAALIALIGRDSFASDLAQVLERDFGLDSFHIFLYRKRVAPVALANCPDPVPHARGLQNYLSYTHVINPAYRAFQQGRAAGVYMISDFIPSGGAPDPQDIDVHIDASEPIGYRTPGWPKNMAEVIVLINLADGSALDLSFLTPLGSAQTAACRTTLIRLFPVLDAVVQRQFALLPASLDTPQLPATQEDRFHDFGGDALTARERDVAQLILIGHSSGSISLNLGISLPTVKTHRRNIYSKLQISSQAELFSLFLLHLK